MASGSAREADRGVRLAAPVRPLPVAAAADHGAEAAHRAGLELAARRRVLVVRGRGVLEREMPS